MSNKGSKKGVDNKLPIAVYRHKSEIEAMGGIEQAREIVNQLIDGYNESKRTTTTNRAT